ncbi:unnamed protein product [Brachionus calyciflorus]|uniref:Probable imidazolonepropionase n=1 Tax=Brachionus calyciflorus TaxID=104777 RepID=A0A813X6E1_9BILA|nr:unnamed protein product [Brachionus calyciflorus]
MNKKLLIHHASQIVQIVSNGQPYLRGSDPNIKNLKILSKQSPSDNLCIVSINGKIEFIGLDTDENYSNFKNLVYDSKIDATNCSILPGLIDSHTHPVWEGDRINEFKMKLEGATYMDIHKAGGGIHFTVRHTRDASECKLYESLTKRLDNFSKSGTTFVECKSGYGLEWETEYKMLKVLTKAKREYKSIGISNTYLGGHAVPIGKTADEATDDIVENQIPKLRDLIRSNDLEVDNIDVFCEKGVFDVEQTERIMTKALQNIENIKINFHSDELYPLNSVEMAVRLKSKAVSHLEEISDSEIELMSKSETVGILLPTTAIIMQLKRPPARKMLNSGCIIALGSDFNPNAYCYAMPLVMNYACIDLRLSMNEALVAATLNSAFALGVEKSKGSLEIGKDADFVVLNNERWENIIYQMGSHDQLIKYVIVNGQIVHQKN